MIILCPFHVIGVCFATFFIQQYSRKITKFFKKLLRMFYKLKRNFMFILSEFYILHLYILIFLHLFQGLLKPFFIHVYANPYNVCSNNHPLNFSSWRNGILKLKVISQMTTCIAIKVGSTFLFRLMIILLLPLK